MDHFLNSFNSFGSVDFGSIFKLNDLTSDIQKHLARVYILLIACMLSASIGVVINMYTGIGNFFTIIASIGLMWWLKTDQRKNEILRRSAILCAFGFFQGCSLSGLIDHVIRVDPSILITALAGTAAIFGCFSLAAVVAKRRSYLFLGGLLSSAMMLIGIISFANIFFWSIRAYMFQLYLGLLVFSGFVIFDTQMIIEKAHFGNRDVAGHAAELFVDLLAIFVRLLIILLKNAKNSERRDNDSRRKKRSY